MVEQMIARRAVAVQQALQSYSDTVLHFPSPNGRPIIADFMSGDPQELPPQGFAKHCGNTAFRPHATGLPITSPTSLRVRPRPPH
jgi:hypothetical protein